MQTQSQTQETIYLDLCYLLRSTGDLVDWSGYDRHTWKSFYQRAMGEGVAPWIYRYFEVSGWPSGCPQQVRELFLKAYYNSLAAHVLWQQEVQRLLAALYDRGIEVLALKGLDLAYSLYSEPALRPMGDLDLLIRETDLQAATCLAEEHGYQLEEELRSMPPALRRLVTYEANFDKLQPAPVHLELHWNLIGAPGSQFQPDIAWFWTQQQARPVLEQKLPGLSATAQFLYAAAHLGIKHPDREARLIWYYDLYLLLEHFSDCLDWNEIIVRAKQFGWQHGLMRVLNGLSWRFAIQVPEFLPAGAHQLLAKIESESSDQPTPREPTRWQGVGKKLNAYGWRTRARWILWLLCPSPAYLRWRYRPRYDWLIPFYYLYRWVDITADGLVTLYRRFSPATDMKQ